MSKTVIVSDIHNQIARADAILAAEAGYDKALFHNDIYDSWGDNPEMARNSAIWFKNAIQDPRHIFLHSNHVWSYMFDTNEFARSCSGFSREKALRIWEVMNSEGNGFALFNLQKPYHLESGILFTHAGISRRLLDWRRIDDDLDIVIEWMDIEHRRAIETYSNGGNAFSYEAGYARNGRYPVGGWTWADFRDEFKPTSFPQIVGHSREEEPMFCAIPHGQKRPLRLRARKAASDFCSTHSWGLCMDTDLNNYAVLEDDVLTIKACEWSSRDSLNNVVQVWQGRIK